MNFANSNCNSDYEISNSNWKPINYPNLQKTFTPLNVEQHFTYLQLETDFISNAWNVDCKTLHGHWTGTSDVFNDTSSCNWILSCSCWSFPKYGSLPDLNPANWWTVGRPHFIKIRSSAENTLLFKRVYVKCLNVFTLNVHVNYVTMMSLQWQQ